MLRRHHNSDHNCGLLVPTRPGLKVKSVELKFFISEIHGVGGGSSFPLEVDIRGLFFPYFFFVYYQLGQGGGGAVIFSPCRLLDDIFWIVKER